MSNAFEPKSFGDRVGYLKQKIGSGALAAAAGVTTSQINRYIKSDSQPTVKPLVSMARAGGVSLLWLATGEGDVHADGSTTSKDTYSRISGETNHPAPVLFNSQLLKSKGINPESCCFITINDDSMGDKLPLNSDLLIDKSRRTGDGIYAIRINGQILIRRVQFMLSGEVKVSSESPDYEDYVLSNDDYQQLDIIGRRVWHGSF
ncbi:S24 family peptidase [uncultured Amphritea sp.]|uniref:S24 family peptidase n=1 Tax=uncultured Amphritea sp. TaxID=981605 RepID=UPI0025F6697B|nr:S24 family peptidase [uncultured Amphritea sp.]